MVRCRALLLLVLPFASPGVSRSAPSPEVAYSIDAVIDDAVKAVRGRAQITVPPDLLSAEGDLDIDAMSAGSDAGGQPLMQITHVRAGGSRDDITWTEVDGRCRVHAVQPKDRKDGVVVTVEFSVPFDGESQEMFGYYLYGADGPGSHWYPDLVGADGSRPKFRSFVVALTHPTRLTVLTSGSANEELSERDQMTTRKMEARHVEGFALSFGEGFALTRVDRPDAHVVAFSRPDMVEKYRTIAGYAADAIAWYRRTYGFSPVGQIGILQGHPKWAGGYPLPNMFMVHLGDLEPEFLRWITSHEFGHYYWGLHVLGDAERLDWLVLANGIWADQLFMAEQTGRTLDDQWRSPDSGDWYAEFVRGTLLNREQELGISDAEENALEFDYNTIVRHAKGAVGVYLQARRIGVDGFLALQRQILREYANRTLTVEDFSDKLEHAGAPGAGSFFREWCRGDASIGYGARVKEVTHTPAGTSYKIAITRQGTIRYPLIVEVLDTRGAASRWDLTGQADEEVVEVSLGAPMSQVRLDPDGILPMWNSSHAGIQRAFLRALSAEGLAEPLIGLARSYLGEHPEDAPVRRRLAGALFGAGRYPEVLSLLQDRQPESCRDIDRCREAIYLVQSLARLGRSEEAAAMLAGIRDGSIRAGLESRWNEAEKELLSEATSGLE